LGGCRFRLGLARRRDASDESGNATIAEETPPTGLFIEKVGGAIGHGCI
jgi:hypothetical protein